MKLTILLIVTLFLVLPILYVLTKREKIYTSFRIEEFPLYPKNLSEIKTGDLIIQRSRDMNWLKRGIWGSAMTHVGMFHRCMHTGQLRVIDAFTGMHYMLFEDVQFVYDGDIFIRPLKHALTKEQLIWTQKAIDELFLRKNQAANTRNVFIKNEHHHKYVVSSVYCSTNSKTAENPFDVNRSDFSILDAPKACINRHLLNSESPNDYAIMCTDVVYVFMQKYGMIPECNIKTCIEPDWFAFDNLNEFYENLFVLKNKNGDPTKIAHGESTLCVNDITVRF